MLINGIVDFGYLFVKNAEELVKSGNHGFLSAFSFATLFLNEIKNRFVLWSVLDKALHNLKAGFAKIVVSSF